MKKKIVFWVLLLGAWGIVLQSCNKEMIPVNNTVATYNSDIAQIMENYCASCHRGEDPSGGLLLTNYAEVREAGEKGKLLDRINDVQRPMPPSGLLSTTKRQQIKTWVDGRYKE